MKNNNFADLDDRARTIFGQIVESFIADGQPVGSRTLSRTIDLSAATIRNVMQDLEFMGLLKAPHISAGRLPTDMGLRYFVDGILEVGGLNETERAALEEQCADENSSVESILENASSQLSQLSQSAGLVIAPKQSNKKIHHVEFVSLSSEQALVIIISNDGSVENRIMPIDLGTTPDMLREAGNFLSEKLHGRTMADMQKILEQEMQAVRSELSAITQRVVASGIAKQTDDGKLIVKGQSQLLDQSLGNDLEMARGLFDQLEAQETVSRLLEEADQANGVKIYIGSENSIFEGTGHSLILSPYHDSQNDVVGAIGVIGPMRLNYAKIIPSVNYMAEILSQRIRSL